MNNKRKLTAGQKSARKHRTFVPRPGIITEIQNILAKAKDKGQMLTVEQILTRLIKKFPDREEAGMEITIRAQLSRLPKEREFGIAKERDGRYTRYAAA